MFLKKRVVLGLPSPSHGVCAGGRTDGRTDVRTYGRTDGRSRDYYVTTKISRIDRLPNFLSNGAPLAGFARRLRYKKKGRVHQSTQPFARHGMPFHHPEKRHYQTHPKERHRTPLHQELETLNPPQL